MRVHGAVLPGVGRLRRRVAAASSTEARRRLVWIEWYESHDRNARQTCRHFTISPDAFYRWLRRYKPRDLSSLEDKSRSPRRLRQHTWSAELEQAVLKLREQYPRWGKDKLAVPLHR